MSHPLTPTDLTDAMAVAVKTAKSTVAAATATGQATMIMDRNSPTSTRFVELTQIPVDVVEEGNNDDGATMRYSGRSSEVDNGGTTVLKPTPMAGSKDINIHGAGTSSSSSSQLQARQVIPRAGEDTTRNAETIHSYEGSNDGIDSYTTHATNTTSIRRNNQSEHIKSEKGKFLSADGQIDTMEIEDNRDDGVEHGYAPSPLAHSRQQGYFDFSPRLVRTRYDVVPSPNTMYDDNGGTENPLHANDSDPDRIDCH